MFSLRSITSARKAQKSVGIREMTVDQAVNAFMVTLDKQAYIDYEAAYEAIAYARQHSITSPARIWGVYNDAVFAAFVD